MSPVQSLDSPNKKNINLPLSTDNLYFTNRKSVKSISSGGNNNKLVTPKFMMKEFETSAASKKFIKSNSNSQKKNNSMSCNINSSNNIENFSYSRTSSLTNLQSKNINSNLPFNPHLSLQTLSLKENNNNPNILSSKDDNLKLNEYNVIANLDTNSNKQNNIRSNASNININTSIVGHISNIKSKNNHTINSSDNKHFNTKSDENKSRSNITNINAKNKNKSNCEHTIDVVINKTPLVHLNFNKIIDSDANHKDNAPNNDIDNHNKYRRNKNNSINFKESKLLRKLITSPTLKINYKRHKSHSITNFPKTQQGEKECLNFEHNFPYKNVIESHLTQVNKPTNYITHTTTDKEKDENELSSSKEISCNNKNMKNNINSNSQIIYKYSFSEKSNNINSNFNNDHYFTTTNLFKVKKMNNQNKLNNTNEKNTLLNSYNSQQLSYKFNNNSENINYTKDTNSLINSCSEAHNFYLNNDNGFKNIRYENKTSTSACGNKNYKNEKKSSKQNINEYNNKDSNFKKNSAIKENYFFSNLNSLNFQNNILYLINLLNEKITKCKKNAFKIIWEYSDRVLNRNKRYGSKIIHRILKKRIVFLKLKFFTRCIIRYSFFVSYNL